MTAILIQDRLDEISNRTINSGGHSSIESGACVMELVSYVAGEPWSDSPECCCPVIAAFLRSWNDGIEDDETRTRLLSPLIATVAGSRSTPEVANRRAYLALDWLVREQVPAALEQAPELVEYAKTLRGLPEITAATASDAVEPIRAACDAARGTACDAVTGAAKDVAWNVAWGAVDNAAWNAVRDAAWNAAWGVVRGAAWNAVRDAARAIAWVAAWNAARSTAEDEAWDAAWNAARERLAPLVSNSQQSALRLVKRMTEIGHP